MQIIINKITFLSISLVIIWGNLFSQQPIKFKHLKVLDRAELLMRKKQGRFQVCSCNPEPIAEAMVWISRHYELWKESFDSLEAFLDDLNKPESG